MKIPYREVSNVTSFKSGAGLLIYIICNFLLFYFNNIAPLSSISRMKVECTIDEHNK